jgi:thioredoxin 2
MAVLELDDVGVILTCRNCGQKNRAAYGRLGRVLRCGRCKAEIEPPEVPIELDRVERFDALIATSEVPVVVDYWAPWCGPCRMVAPEIERVAARAARKFIVAKVNTEELPQLGARFGIRSIPTMAIYHQGRELARTVGAQPAPEIEAFIDRSIGSANRVS